MQKRQSVTLLNIATNKYKSFVLPLLKSVDAHFFNGHDVSIVLFTDEPNYFKALEHDIPERLNLTVIQIPPYKFPYATLYRYKIFSENAKYIKGEYCFYCDADMLFVGDVGEEILPAAEEKIGAVLHPGFFNGGGSWESRWESTACIPQDKTKHYFAGGFNFGFTKDFMLMSRLLDAAVDADMANGLIAVHNDESHLNWYLSKLKSFKILNPSYCMVEQPELRIAWGINQFEPKLLALAKDHKSIRE